MNPHKMNKVDVSKMSEEDQKALAKYGRLPQKNLLSKMQKDRKYFDSGDYMMSKAGVPTAQAPGTAIPTPEGLPHAFSPSASTSPTSLPVGSSSSSSPTSTTGHAIPAPGTGAGLPSSVGSGAGKDASVGLGVSPGSGSGSGSTSTLAPGAGLGSGSSAVGVGGAGVGASPTGNVPGSVNIPIPGRTPVQAHGSTGSQDGERPNPGLLSLHRGSVGVGISPAAGDEGLMGVGHRRRPSESGNRTSPPAPLREGSMPSSSFPIHHNSFGSSPVKTSMLARRMEVNENE